MKKIAIPTRDGHVDDHFGHCDHYTIYTVENNQIIATDTMASPQGCGCKSGVAAQLKELGVEVMLAGNMGEGAKNKLEAENIKVLRGCTGNVETVVKSFLAGILLDSGQGCSGHSGDHQCGEHHSCHNS